ncbi:hypothetical protein PoB_006624800 [Plakobranchus ocellatus]|uniref:Uncharacterized protein n=1 Tax=Plakobranchus ocellatus TaxID=259542 RepID=A0AAV4D6Q5_9GAST|nr:hypothetical protein PoB_006624800 [Plakobranchus ocellatus]
MNLIVSNVCIDNDNRQLWLHVIRTMDYTEVPQSTLCVRLESVHNINKVIQVFRPSIRAPVAGLKQTESLAMTSLRFFGSFVHDVISQGYNDCTSTSFADIFEVGAKYRGWTLCATSLYLIYLTEPVIV